MKFETDGKAEVVMSIGEELTVWSNATGQSIVVTATGKGIEVKRDG